MIHNPLILITRPHPDALDTQAALETLGCRCMIEPMLTFSMAVSVPDILKAALLKPFHAIILTSRNGVRALHQLIEPSLLPYTLLTVGEETCALAKRYGFRNVYTAGRTSTELIAYIRQHYPPTSHFIIIGGTHSAWDSGQELSRYQYTRTYIPLYEMKACTRLSSTLIHTIKNRTLDGITFFSLRTARIFLQHAQEQELLIFLSTLRAFCLSSAMKKQIPCHYFASVESSPIPTASSLREVIGKSFLL